MYTKCFFFVFVVRSDSNSGGPDECCKMFELKHEHSHAQAPERWEQAWDMTSVINSLLLLVQRSIWLAV